MPNVNSSTSDSPARFSNQELQVLVENVQDYAFILTNPEGLITAWSRGAELLLGYREPEILGQSADLFFTPEDIFSGQPEKEMQTALSQGCADDERWHVRKDSSRFYASGVMTAVRNEDGTLRGFVKILRDHTEQKQAEEQLRASEERFRLIVDNVRDYAIFQVDLVGKVTGWNPGAERVLGYSESEILGKSIEVLSIPEDRAAATMRIELEQAGVQGSAEDERWIVRTDGRRIWCRWITNAIYDDVGAIRGFVKVLADETERRRDHEQIRASLREKEALLQEIHHRVKNNLQVVISLLNLQAGYITDEQARLALEQTTNRLYSIAEIHEMLYSSEELARVDFNEYLQRLATQLLALHGTPSERVRVLVDRTKLLLPIRQAIPCGLIANELLMNALKYAFPGNRSGTISISCVDCVDSNCVLRIADDGVGLPPEVNWRHAQSMGLRLMRVLTDQLGGTLELEPTEVGVSFGMHFPRASSEGETHEQGTSSSRRG